MDMRSATRDWQTRRDRFCAETQAVAATLSAILRQPPDEREEPQIERCFTRLARLRADLAALLREQQALAAAPGYRRLRLSERRELEDQAPFGADPRRVLDVWNRVVRSARLAAGYSPAPLYPRNESETDPEVQRWNALDRAMTALHEFVNPRDAQDQAARDDGYFTDIPLPSSVFLADCHAAYRTCLAQDRTAPVRFLDVGCGGGVKVLMASQFFARAHGLEVDPGFYAAADGLLARVGRGRCDAIKGNALSFGGYRDYDVIYFYQPIRDPDLLMQLEQRITGEAWAGTVLVAPYAGFADRGPELGCGHVSGHVWVTHSSQEEADALAERAREMGTVITPEPLDGAQQAGVLGPVAEALNDQGFVIV